jgi:hypothetical protein
MLHSAGPKWWLLLEIPAPIGGSLGYNRCQDSGFDKTPNNSESSNFQALIQPDNFAGGGEVKT